MVLGIRRQQSQRRRERKEVREREKEELSIQQYQLHWAGETNYAGRRRIKDNLLVDRQEVVENRWPRAPMNLEEQRMSSTDGEKTKKGAQR